MKIYVELASGRSVTGTLSGTAAARWAQYFSHEAEIGYGPSLWITLDDEGDIHLVNLAHAETIREIRA